jgi:hypothetical protein
MMMELAGSEENQVKANPDKESGNLVKSDVFRAFSEHHCQMPLHTGPGIY